MHVMHHYCASLLKIRYAFAQNLNNSSIFVSERETGGQNCGIGMTGWRRVDHVEVRSAQTSAAHSEQYFARLGMGTATSTNSAFSPHSIRYAFMGLFADDESLFSAAS